MDLGDVVISKDIKRHIVTGKVGERYQLVCVKTGTISHAFREELYYYRAASVEEVVTAYENGAECRNLLLSLDFAKKFLRKHVHRGDDYPSMLY